MDDDEERRRTAWRLVVRRARGVPDIVSDEVAFADDPLAKEIADAGATGQLRQLEELFAGQTNNVREVAESTVTALRDGRGKGDVDVTEEVVTTLYRFVMEHPFQANCGCHFR